MQKLLGTAEIQERTMDIRSWSFWLGLYSVLTQKPKKVNIELTEYVKDINT